MHFFARLSLLEACKFSVTTIVNISEVHLKHGKYLAGLFAKIIFTKNLHRK